MLVSQKNVCTLQITINLKLVFIRTNIKIELFFLIKPINYYKIKLSKGSKFIVI